MEWKSVGVNVFDNISTVPTTGRDRMPQECQAWLKNGDCFLHQEFMLQNCRETCLAGGYVRGKCTFKQKHIRGSILSIFINSLVVFHDTPQYSSLAKSF